MSHRYDLHLHSRASADCRTPYRALIAMARRRGLSGLALTDHDTLDGFAALTKIWPHSELQLIAGCERTLFDGSHVIGLFLSRNLTATTAREVIGEIRAQGGLVYLPHPCRAYSGLLGAGSQHSAADRDWAIEEADVIEIFNRKCTPEENALALELLDRYPRKAYAAASDAHYAHEIGYACTEFNEPLSRETFRPTGAFTPPAHLAAELSSFRHADSASSLRTQLRATAKALGLLNPARSVRNYIRSYRQPRLQKYR